MAEPSEVSVSSNEINDSSDEVKDACKGPKEISEENDSKVVEAKFDDSSKDKAVGMQGASADNCEQEEIIFIPEDLKYTADSEEDIVIMTGEEMRNYLLEKIAEYMKDPRINPLLALKKRTEDLREKIQQTVEEYKGVSKCFEQMGQDHIKFLRYKGILPKVPTRDVSVSADFPSLPLRDATVSADFPPLSNLVTTLADSSEVLQFRVNPSTLEIGFQTGTTPAQSGSVTTLAASTHLAAATTAPKCIAEYASDQPVECIDLTNESDTVSSDSNPLSYSKTRSCQNPSPLPVTPNLKENELLPPPPPKPQIKISAEENEIVLQWDFPARVACGKLSSFEIFGHQEQRNVKVSRILWKKLASVKADKLPMAATLKQFVDGYTYIFCIRAIDIYGQKGSFSEPARVLFELQTSKAKNNI